MQARLDSKWVGFSIDPKSCDHCAMKFFFYWGGGFQNLSEMEKDWSSVDELRATLMKYTSADVNKVKKTADEINIPGGRISTSSICLISLTSSSV